MTTEIRNFQQEDMPQLGELYKEITTRDNIVFWWVGEESNWVNVYCAFENGKMVAKGQVSIINIVPPGRSVESKHSIYINLKTIPERETDFVLLDTIYAYLYARALQLKESLSTEYKTILCAGNDSAEKANNDFFIDQKDYQHLNSLFTMKRNLSEPISEINLDKDFQYKDWMMESTQEESEYLELNAEVWPDTPLGIERLAEYKRNPLWKSVLVSDMDAKVGNLMVWKEEDGGTIEDVFVRSSWRKRGIAKFMLTEALKYLKFHGLESAQLMVLTDNQSALDTYRSVGFKIAKEEIRYFTELV